MSMGKRKRDRQPSMWVATTDLPTATSHQEFLTKLAKGLGIGDADARGLGADRLETEKKKCSNGD